MGMGRGAGDLDHVSQAWPAGMAWPRAPSKFAMYRKTISCWRLPGARPGWLAWPGRARHQHSRCTGRTSSCRKPSFVKGAGPRPGTTNLLSTGKPSPCRKPPFVKGAGPGPAPELAFTVPYTSILKQPHTEKLENNEFYKVSEGQSNEKHVSKKC